MNERIRLLAEQSGVTVLTTHGMEDVVDGCYVIGPARLEMFAELIVRECMRMCDVAAIGYDMHGLFKEANGASLARVYIADWFEIEEDSEVESDEEETCPRCGAPDSGTSCGLPDCGWVTGEQE